MQTYTYEGTVDEKGSVDFKTQIPELKGQRIKVIVLPEAETEGDVKLQEMLQAVDQDWEEWRDPNEDIYEDYRKYIS
jgi:hypothetical protein